METLMTANQTVLDSFAYTGIFFSSLLDHITWLGEAHAAGVGVGVPPSKSCL